MAAEAEVVVQIEGEVHLDGGGGAGVGGFFFAEYHHVVIQPGHAGFLEAEVAAVYFEPAVERHAAPGVVEQAAVAAEGELAVGVVEDGVAGELGVYVYVGGGAGEVDAAFELDAAVFAGEFERVDHPVAALEAGAEAAVIQNHAGVAVAVVEVFAGGGAVEAGLAHAAGHGGVDGERAFGAHAAGQEVADGVELGDVEFQVAVDRGLADGVAKLLAHGHGGVERAVAGFAGEAVVDAAAVEAGVEHEVAQAQCLLAVGDNHVAGLLGEFQVACGVAAVAQVPIAGHHELQFDGFVVFA